MLHTLGFNFDSLRAGLLFVLLVLPYLVLGPVFGAWVDRSGPRPAAVVGYAFLCPVLVLLRLPNSGGTGQIVLYFAILALAGVGLSAVGAPSIVESSAVVAKFDEEHPGFFGKQGPYAQLYGVNSRKSACPELEDVQDALLTDLNHHHVRPARSVVFCAGLTAGPLFAGGLSDSIGYENMNAIVGGLCAVTALVSWRYTGRRRRSE